MSVIVLKYRINSDKVPDTEHIKLFKNNVSCDRFVTQMNTGLGEPGWTINSRKLDNRATKTIKKLMRIPKRRVGKKS